MGQNKKQGGLIDVYIAGNKVATLTPENALTLEKKPINKFDGYKLTATVVMPDGNYELECLIVSSKKSKMKHKKDLELHPFRDAFFLVQNPDIKITDLLTEETFKRYNENMIREDYALLNYKPDVEGVK